MNDLGTKKSPSLQIVLDILGGLKAVAIVVGWLVGTVAVIAMGVAFGWYVLLPVLTWLFVTTKVGIGIGGLFAIWALGAWMRAQRNARDDKERDSILIGGLAIIGVLLYMAFLVYLFYAYDYYISGAVLMLTIMTVIPFVNAE